MMVLKRTETFITKTKRVTNKLSLDNETKFLDKLFMQRVFNKSKWCLVSNIKWYKTFHFIFHEEKISI